MSGKLPWMKFYPGDWAQDTTPLSLAGRGAWITIVCAMWRSTERGKLSMPLAGFCRLLGAPEAETLAVLEELSVTGIASRVTEADKKVTLTCRRMVREFNSHRNHALRQQRYREAHQVDAQVTGEKSEVRSQKSEEDKNKRAQAPRSLSRKFMKPTAEQVTEYGRQIGFKLDGQTFCDFYESKGWVIGKSPMKSWQAAVKTWKRREHTPMTRPIPRKSYAESKTVIRDRAVREIVLSLEASKAGAVSNSDYQDAITAMSDKYRDAPGTLKEALEIIKGRQRSLVKV